MPSLTRSTRPLLRQVNGLQHASDHDHEPVVGEEDQEDEEEDYMRDPDSSEDELTRPPAASDLEKLSKKTTTSTKRKSDDESDKTAFGSSAKRQKASKEPARFRTVPAVKPARDNDSGDDIFPASSQVKRLTKPAVFRTLSQPSLLEERSGDALPRSSQIRPTSSATRAQKESTKTYGARKGQTKARAHKPFQVADVVVEQATEQSAKFKGIDGIEMFSSSLEEVPSSPPSSPLSPPPDDILDLTGSPTTRVRCEVCHSMVPQTLREEYEDKYNEGRALRVIKQRAFCRYHQQYEAEQEWQQQGYPEIVWDELVLGKRMRQQHNRLIKILRAQQDSEFKRRLAERIKSRVDRTVAKAMAGGNDVSAGYYGPRGQKMMLEHVSEHLSAELRQASTANALIGTAGVGGGIPGFVQSVLVPEMAVGLIAEDMSCSFGEAMLILERSKSLGDVLCEELRERVIVNVESSNAI